MTGRGLLAVWTIVAVLLATWHAWPEISAWLKERQELAGWIQAIGSIAAIAATGWAVQRAHKLQERQRREDEFSDYTRLLETVFQLVAVTQRMALRLIEAINTGAGHRKVSSTTLTIMFFEISALSSALKRIDVTRLDRIEFVEAVLAANSLAPRLMSLLESAIQLSESTGHADGNLILKHADAAAQILGSHRKAMARIIASRGGVLRDDALFQK